MAAIVSKNVDLELPLPTDIGNEPSPQDASIVVPVVPRTHEDNPALHKAEPFRVGLALNGANHRKALLVLADVFIAAVATLSASFLAISFFGENSAELAELTVLAILLWPFVFATQDLYQSIHIQRRSEEWRRVLTAGLYGCAAIAAISAVLEIPISRAWLVGLGVLTVGITLIEREFVRLHFAHAREKGEITRKVILIGDGHESSELDRYLLASPHLGYQVTERVNTPQNSAEVLALLEVARTSMATGAIIASGEQDCALSNDLIRALTREGIYVQVLSSMQDIASRRVHTAPLGGFPMMRVTPSIQAGWKSLLKRAFDLLVAVCALVLLSPLLLLCALVLRITSGRTVLFRQTRIGRNGVPFTMYKFRSMVVNAEDLLSDLLDQNEAAEPMFKMSDDPRVTPFGKFLRTTSLDELPQLINVVRGEMSLVGPRPATADEVTQWEPAMLDRLRAQPGITGYWQIHGRFTSTLEEYQRLDMYYVDNWSLLTDSIILLKTVPAVISRRGAA